MDVFTLFSSDGSVGAVKGEALLLALTAASLVFCLSMAVLAARAAKSARQARAEAEAALRSAQDFVVEARQLSARIDRAQSNPASINQSGAAPLPIRVSSRATTSEADVKIEQRRAPGIVAKGAKNAVPSSRDLDAARESATVPSGLIRRQSAR